MKNILLIPRTGIYNAQKKYIHILAEMFRRFGYNTIIWESDISEAGEDLQWIINHYQIDMIFDSNGAQYCVGETDRGGILPPEVMRISYFCDHPMYHKETLDHLHLGTIICNVDRKNVEYLNKYYPKYKNVFLPLAGVKSSIEIPWEKREIEVLFLGSYISPVEAAQMPVDRDGMTARIRWDVQDILLKFPCYTMEDALRKVLMKYEITVSDDEFSGVMSELTDIEQYVRFYFRDMMIRECLKKGIRITVFGNGWDTFEGIGKENLIYRTGAGTEAAERALGNAKIALNIMPWFKAGLQERIVSGMLSGAVAVTDTSEYIEEEFQDGEDILIYRLDDLQKLPEKIKYILENEEEGKRIARNGQQKAEERHTWMNRAQEILRLAGWKETTQGQQEGRELEIGREDILPSRILYGIGSELSEEVNRINQLYQNDMLMFSDVEQMLSKFRSWNEKAKSRCDFELIKEQNFAILQDMIGESRRDVRGDVVPVILLLDNVMQRIQEKTESLELENLFCGKCKSWSGIAYNKFVKKYFLAKYGDSQDAAIRLWMDSIRETGRLASYPEQLIFKYYKMPAEVGYDCNCGMCYVMHRGKRMYYPKDYSPENAYVAYRFCCIEQDENSPHRYLDETFTVETGAVVIDAGAAEGNFSLDIIDKVSRLYLVECEKKWIEALQMTFLPYKDKVVLVPKMIGSTVDEEHITIDAIADGEPVDFIKMDVEGAEGEALLGAVETIEQNAKMKWVIATYHKHGMEERVKTFLGDRGFQVSNTEGYLYYSDYKVPVYENELRHALVRAER